MEFTKLNDKLQKIADILSMFKIQDEDGYDCQGCDKDTWMIIEISVNCEKSIWFLNPKAVKIVYDRIVEYGKTHEKISFYGFNRYVMDLGDPAYFTSDLMIAVIQDDEFGGFGSHADKESFKTTIENDLDINPNNPDLSESDWCMDWEK